MSRLRPRTKGAAVLVCLGWALSPVSHSQTAIPSTPEVAADLLWKRLFPAPRGIYSLESDVNFNVLDSVVFDPENGRLSLIGHRDERFRGSTIPYLQYLATLLEQPNPEFSLAFTPDSGQRVKELTLKTASPSDCRTLAKQWTTMLDASGELSEAAKLILPQLGITPIRDGRRPGFLGVDAEDSGSGTVKVTNVQPGSPAAEAGLKSGDLILGFDDKSTPYAAELYRLARFAGAGTRARILYAGPSGATSVAEVTMGAEHDPDPWKLVTKYDIGSLLYRAAGKTNAANVVYALGLEDEVQTGHSGANQAGLESLLVSLGIYSEMQQIREDVRARGMTLQEAQNKIGRRIAMRLEEIFELPAGSISRSYDSTMVQTQSWNAAIGAIMSEFDKRQSPRFQTLLDSMLTRTQGLEIPDQLIERELNGYPELTPHFTGLPSNSQLARLMFECDYLCDRMLSRPELKATIPSYRTYVEFESAKPNPARKLDTYRLWLSVDHVDAATSRSGKTLQFFGCKMKFGAGDAGPNGRPVAANSGSYEEVLTSIYEPLATQFTPLHELQEAAKLAAAAQWIHSQKPTFHLPADGAPNWVGPSRVPGLLSLHLYATGTQSAFAGVVADCGVSLRGVSPYLDSQVSRQPGTVVDMSRSELVLAVPAFRASLGSGSSVPEPTVREAVDGPNSAFAPAPGGPGRVASSDVQSGVQALTLNLTQLDKPANQIELGLDLRQNLDRFRFLTQEWVACERALGAYDSNKATGMNRLNERQAGLIEEVGHLKRQSVSSLEQLGDNLLTQLSLANEPAEVAAELKALGLEPTWLDDPAPPVSLLNELLLSRSFSALHEYLVGPPRTNGSVATSLTGAAGPSTESLRLLAEEMGYPNTELAPITTAAPGPNGTSAATPWDAVAFLSSIGQFAKLKSIMVGIEDLGKLEAASSRGVTQDAGGVVDGERLLRQNLRLLVGQLRGECLALMKDPAVKKAVLAGHG